MSLYSWWREVAISGPSLARQRNAIWWPSIARLVALWILGVQGHPIALWFYRGRGTGSAHDKYPQMRILPLCVSMHFSVSLSICLSKYLHVFVCMYVCLYLPLPLSLSLSLSLNICGVVPADQSSWARYQAFQVFCWDSKSVPFPINLSRWKSLSWY